MIQQNIFHFIDTQYSHPQSMCSGQTIKLWLTETQNNTLFQPKWVINWSGSLNVYLSWFITVMKNTSVHCSNIALFTHKKISLRFIYKTWKHPEYPANRTNSEYVMVTHVHKPFKTWILLFSVILIVILICRKNNYLKNETQREDDEKKKKKHAVSSLPS